MATKKPAKKAAKKAVKKAAKRPANQFKPRDDIDWAGVEHAYRAGKLSNRAIGHEYGISEARVRQQAKALGWIKGDMSRVRQRAREKADAIDIPRYVEPGPEQVEALAELGAHVLVRHRRVASSLHSLVADMARQLDHQTHHEPELAEQIKDFFDEKAANNPIAAHVYKQQCNAALHAIGLGNRSKTLVNLATAADKVITIERKAYDLDDDDDKRTYEDLLTEIYAKLQANPA